MARQASAETLLRAARSELKRAYADLTSARQLTSEYRARATRAEQEAAEWKARFDLLLRRDDQQKAGASHG